MKETTRSKLTSFDLDNFKIINNFDVTVHNCVAQVTMVDVRFSFHQLQSSDINCLDAIHREFANEIVDRIEWHA